MSIDLSVLRAALDCFITGLIELRDEFLRAERAAAKEKRLQQQAELAALYDLADADAEPDPE